MIAAATIGLALLFAADAASVATIYAILLVRALGEMFHAPAMSASTPLMVPEQHLARIAGINQTLTGMITGPEKLAALRECDVFVLPSQSEGSSIALLEALHAGLPVLISDRVGLCRDVERLQGGIVVPLAIDELYRGLSALASPETRASMRGNATDWIRAEYSWPAIADKMLAELDPIAGRSLCCSH